MTMEVALRLARDYGVAIACADLGDWGSGELRSEYDPAGPAIRLNRRVAQRLSRWELDEFIALAVGHELYHHRESIGEIPACKDRKAREAAADDFARRLLERSP
jgi:hypothetical protein